MKESTEGYIKFSLSPQMNKALNSWMNDTGMSKTQIGRFCLYEFLKKEGYFD